MSPTYSICFNKPSNHQLPCDINNKQAVEIFRRDNPHIMANFIPNGMPFIVCDDNGVAEKLDISWRKLQPDLASQLRSLLLMETEQRVNIAKILNQYGSNMLTALAEFHETELLPMIRTNFPKVDPRKPSNLNGYASALVGATEYRLTAFTRITRKYQLALENVRQGTLSKLPKAEMIKLEQLAKNLHKELNIKFSAEINKYFSKAGSRGSVWTRAERGINLAKSSRNFQPISLSSTKELRMIKNLTRRASRTGVVGLVVDAGFRANSVYDEFQSGENWQKSAAIETTSFASAGLGAVYIGGAGASIAGAVLGVTLAATPVGWVIIIGAGLAAGFAGAMIGDKIGRKASTYLYNNSQQLSFW
jgi:hypothetical protein